MLPDMSKSGITSPPASSMMNAPLHPNLDPVQNLVVLVPLDSDYSAATSQIWELANATGMRVLLLGLCKNEAEEPGLRRGLTTMSAMIRIGRVFTDVKIEIGMNWEDAVRLNYQPGDMIVCFAERGAGLHPRPLRSILESKLHAPVHILSSLSPQRSTSSWLGECIVWSGFMVLVIAFGILQIRIVQLPNDWFQNVLFILSTILEFWLIVVWNGLFR